jgi:hypothetical protein
MAEQQGAQQQGAGKPAKKPTRPPAEIEAELVATRERLVSNIAQIEDYVKPANVADRGKRKVQAFFTDDANNVRWDRVAMTAGVVVGGLVALRLTTKGLRWALGGGQGDVLYLPVPRSQAAAIAAAISA